VTYQEERMREVMLRDQVAREILQAHIQVKSRHLQIENASPLRGKIF
jgi:hypothetical protein